MILVVGSTGFVGQRVVRKLASQGRDVRALVRPSADPTKVAALGAGVDIARGDLKDEPSLAAACSGAATVVSTASATISRGPGDTIETVDRDGQLRLADAAKAAGVGHFIYLSFSGNMRVPSPLHDAKRAVERRIQTSGMAFTIVRPSIFMEVWLTPHVGFDPKGGHVRIFGTGDAPVSVVSAADVADFISACVDNPAARNQVLELGGPEPIAPNAIVSRFEQALGRTVERQFIPEAALEQQFAAAPDSLQRTLAALALGVARGDAIDNSRALNAAPIALTPLSVYVDRVVRIVRI
jgi:NADH dehydrogenase